jgi:hypothetical protein
MPKKKEAAGTAAATSPSTSVDAKDNKESETKLEKIIIYHGYFSGPEEEEDEPILLHDLTRRSLKRCFAALQRHAIVRLLVSRAFLNRALLTRGFSELRWNTRRRKADTYRRRFLLHNSLDYWREVFLMFKVR